MFDSSKLNANKNFNVFVGGCKIDVKFDESQESLGYSSVDEMSIVLKPSSNYDMKLSTLIHEMTHIALDLGGIGFALNEHISEAVVRNIEHILIPSLTNNKVFHHKKFSEE